MTNVQLANMFGIKIEPLEYNSDNTSARVYMTVGAWGNSSYAFDYQDDFNDEEALFERLVGDGIKQFMSDVAKHISN